MTTTMPVQDIELHLVSPNDWNPNEQTPRQYAAERESLIKYGFVVPVIVRPQGDRFQLIDGEHRYNAMHEFTHEAPAKMHPQLRDLVEAKRIPAVVLDVSDAEAKKLTMTFNETRGQANLAKRAALLSELSAEMDMPDLLLALPWDEGEMQDMLTMGDFDWESLGGDVNPDDFTPEDKPKAVVVVVDESDVQLWQAVVERWREAVGEPRNDKAAATAVLSHLLAHIEEMPEP